MPSHVCEICGQTGFLEESALLQHSIEAHQVEAQCPLCDLRGADLTPEQIAAHVQAAHPDDDGDEGEDTFRPNEKASLSSESGADRSEPETLPRKRTKTDLATTSMRPPLGRREENRPEGSSDVNDGEKDNLTYSCPLCSYEEKNPAALQVHVNRTHFDPSSPSEAGRRRSPTSTCPFCPSTFADVSELQSHVDSHREIPAEQEDLAGRRRTSFDLNSNDTVGKKEESSCPVCRQKGFPDHVSLTRHINDHFGRESREDEEPADDLILAQVLQRQEREASRFQEQQEFKRLQEQYGMGESDGNFRQQSQAAMERDVRRGQMSVTDYHEREAILRRSEALGTDDYSTVTANPIIDLRSLTNTDSYFCTDCDHFSSAPGDYGWGCGYRNLQMLLSSLLKNPPFRDVLSAPPVSLTRMPSISRLQQLIENAWSAGFDAPGRDQLGGKLSGTRKWIGATEVAAFLLWAGIDVEVVDFHKPSSNGLHPKLFSWVLDQFRSQRLPQPLYLQHQGHSRTVVGAELSGSNIRLFVFDPSHKRMNREDKKSLLRSLRKNTCDLKSRQYQIVKVLGVFSSRAAAERRKAISSTRIA